MKSSEDIRNYLKTNPYVLAPMVDHSDFPFRMLTRKYGAGLCFTPMLHSRLLIQDEKYARKMFVVGDKEDRPLVVQLCGNDKNILLQAVLKVKNHCDIVDLNLGCPQKIAKRGNYGSYLLEEKNKVLDILTHLVKNSGTLISAKIRIFDDREDSLNYCKDLEKTGICMLTVHGRTRFQNKEKIGTADWEFIKKIKNSLSIPVICNGSIEKYEDVIKCLKETGCDGVMSAEGILENPALFSGEKLKDIDLIAEKYLEYNKKYPDQVMFIKSHLFKMLHTGLKIHTDLRSKLGQSRTFEEFESIVKEMKERRKNVSIKEKYGWYRRYWKKPIPESLTEIEKEIIKKRGNNDKNEKEIETEQINKKVKTE